MTDKEVQAKIEKQLLRILSKNFPKRLLALALARARRPPPQGFDSWADYEKYGDAFIPMTLAPSTELAVVPKSDDP